jgi:uncharacterized protein (DUF2252 family)
VKLRDIEGRLPILHAKRDLKMARSAHAYVRGNTQRFYDWLADPAIAELVPAGPEVWICGDCHLGNLGPLANDDGRVAIQIRDLDQAVIGNPAHDLIRLGLSLATAARSSDLPGVTTARMIEEMVDGYERAIAEYEDGNPGEEPDVVRTVRRRALGRKWRHLARERLEDVTPTIPLGKKFWPEELKSVVTSPQVAQLALSLDQGDQEREPRLADAAYWIKGCSSLGLARFAVIVALKGKTTTDHALIDLKEAVAPVAPAAPGVHMPSDQAERVVAAARALSPHLGARIAATRVLGRSMFVRELMPQDLKIEIEQFSSADALKSARYLAFVVGKAHARQMDLATRNEWSNILQRGRSGGLDAPSWLWRSIVALAAHHEAGYLDHCRTFALASQK